MSTIIDKSKALELLHKAVDEKGNDYVYPRGTGLASQTCTYERNGEPSCIVGHALAYVGVPVEHLKVLDSLSDPAIGNDTTIATLEEDYEVGAEASYFDPETDIGPSAWLETNDDVVLTEEALLVFATAQNRQDAGTPWGEAVRDAERLRRAADYVTGII